MLSNDPCDPCSTRTYDLEYSYDLRGELLTNQITFDQDPCSTIGHTFTYHDNGNINSKQVTGQGTTDYSYTGDQMTGVDSQTLVWGKNGNMTTGTSAVIEYNWDNKLRSAEIDESDVLTAVKYDPDGNRVYKEIPGDPGPVKRKYIVDIVGRLPVILLVMDADNNNSVVSSYVYANSQVLAQYDGTQEGANDKHFYLHDRLGSVRLLIDESGDVANTYTYQPFGRIIEDSSDWPQAPSNDFKFTGQWFDSEIDQYYLRARMYDPEVARAATKRPFQIHTNLPSS